MAPCRAVRARPRRLRRVGGAAAAFWLFASFGACGDPAPEEVPPPESAPAPVRPPPLSEATADDRPAIVAFGDSLTAGYGVDVTEAWPARLQERLDAEGHAYRVVNAGVSGETTAGGLRRLPWVLDREPEARLVVLALGGNDGLRGSPPDAMAENLLAMIGEAERRGLRVLLAGVPSPPELGPDYEEAFAAVFPDVAAQSGVALVEDILEGVAGVPELNQRDRTHPNPEGARRLAATVWRGLEPLLGEPGGAAAVTEGPEAADAEPSEGEMSR